MEIAAQIIGFAAMAMNALSYQAKKQRTIIIFQLFGSLLFAVHFIMLGAMIGGLLNIIGIIRAAVYSNKEKTGADNPLWIAGFVAAYVASYVLQFTVFGREPTAFNLIVEVLPVFAMTITTVSFWLKDAKKLRRLGLINSPLWLIYNAVSHSISGVCSEVFNLVSLIVAIVRLDIGKKAEK